MTILDRKALLSKEALTIEKVDLGREEFVFVRQMTGRERDTFEKSLLKEIKDEKGGVISVVSDTEDFRAKLAVVTLCDEKGLSLLSPEDYPKLSQNMSAFRLDKIVTAAQRLNAITDEAKEDIVKNSVPDQAANSSSGFAGN